MVNKVNRLRKLKSEHNPVRKYDVSTSLERKVQPSSCSASSRKRKASIASTFGRKPTRSTKNSSCSDSGIDSPLSISKNSLRSKKKLFTSVSEPTGVMDKTDMQLNEFCCIKISDENISATHCTTEKAVAREDSNCSSDSEITFNFSRTRECPKNLAPLPTDILAFEADLEFNNNHENDVKVVEGHATSTPEKEFIGSSIDMKIGNNYNNTEITLYESPEKLSHVELNCGSPTSVSSDSFYFEEVVVSPENGNIVIHNSALKSTEENVKKPANICEFKMISSLKKSHKTYLSPLQIKKNLFKENVHPNRKCASERKSKPTRAQVNLDKWASLMNDHFKEIEDSDLCID